MDIGYFLHRHAETAGIFHLSLHDSFTVADRNGSNTPLLTDKCIKLAPHVISDISVKWYMGF